MKDCTVTSVLCVCVYCYCKTAQGRCVSCVTWIMQLKQQPNVFIGRNVLSLFVRMCHVYCSTALESVSLQLTDIRLPASCCSPPGPIRASAATQEVPRCRRWVTGMSHLRQNGHFPKRPAECAAGQSWGCEWTDACVEELQDSIQKTSTHHPASSETLSNLCAAELKEIITTKQEVSFHGRINLQTLRSAVVRRQEGRRVRSDKPSVWRRGDRRTCGWFYAN